MNKQKLIKEFNSVGYGSKPISIFSKEAQNYLKNRHKKGIKELKSNNQYPTETYDNGYTKLLGMWTYTKSRGIDCAVGKKTVWMATILNNEI